MVQCFIWRFTGISQVAVPCSNPFLKTFLQLCKVFRLQQRLLSGLDRITVLRFRAPDMMLPFPWLRFDSHSEDQRLFAFAVQDNRTIVRPGRAGVVFQQRPLPNEVRPGHQSILLIIGTVLCHEGPYVSDVEILDTFVRPAANSKPPYGVETIARGSFFLVSMMCCSTERPVTADNGAQVLKVGMDSSESSLLTSLPMSICTFAQRNGTLPLSLYLMLKCRSPVTSTPPWQFVDLVQ
jgi:hypothetical protein